MRSSLTHSSRGPRWILAPRPLSWAQLCVDAESNNKRMSVPKSGGRGSLEQAQDLAQCSDIDPQEVNEKGSITFPAQTWNDFNPQRTRFPSPICLLLTHKGKELQAELWCKCFHAGLIKAHAQRSWMVNFLCSQIWIPGLAFTLQVREAGHATEPPYHSASLFVKQIITVSLLGILYQLSDIANVNNLSQSWRRENHWYLLGIIKNTRRPLFQVSSYFISFWLSVSFWVSVSQPFQRRQLGEDTFYTWEKLIDGQRAAHPEEIT